MRHEVQYETPLGTRADAAVRFVTEDGSLVAYSVVLRVWDDEQMKPVRLFDNAHGVHDMHRYTRWGEKRPAVRFHDGTPSEAMNAARQAIKIGWREMVESWRR